MPLAIEFGKKHQTVGFDINIDRIEDLKNGIDHTNEATPEQLRSAQELTFSSDINDIKDSTIYMHLAEAIEVGLIAARDVLGLRDEDYVEIVRMIESFGEDDKGRLKPVYDAFEGQYNYGVLRCVRAGL